MRETAISADRPGTGTPATRPWPATTSAARIYLATLGYSSGNLSRCSAPPTPVSTWHAPVNGAPGLRQRDQLDKEWIAVDNAAGPGQGNVYLVFTDFANFGRTTAST